MKIITAPQPIEFGARMPGMLEIRKVNSNAVRSNATLANIILPGVMLQPLPAKKRNTSAP